MATTPRPSLAPSLPLSLAYEPLHRSIVKQHWNVTFARQGKMSVTAKRIMARVLDQIRDDDFHLREYYQLAIADIRGRTRPGTENPAKPLSVAKAIR